MVGWLESVGWWPHLAYPGVVQDLSHACPFLGVLFEHAPHQVAGSRGNGGPGGALGVDDAVQHLPGGQRGGGGGWREA